MQTPMNVYLVAAIDCGIGEVLLPVIFMASHAEMSSRCFDHSEEMDIDDDKSNKRDLE